MHSSSRLKNQVATVHFLANIHSNVSVLSTPQWRDDDTNILIMVFMQAMGQTKQLIQKSKAVSLVSCHYTKHYGKLSL